MNDNIIASVSLNEAGETNNLKDVYGSFGFVFNDEGMIAVMHLKTVNEYELPGGVADAGETPQQVFEREALEETGAKLRNVKNLGIIKEIKQFDSVVASSSLFTATVEGELIAPKVTKLEQELGITLEWMIPHTAQRIINSYKPNSDIAKIKQLRDQAAFKHLLTEIGAL